MEDKSSSLVSFKRTKGRDAVSVHLNYEQVNTNTSLLTNQQLIETLRLAMNSRTYLQRKYQVAFLATLLVIIGLISLGVHYGGGTPDSSNSEKDDFGPRIKHDPKQDMQIQTSTETPILSLRNLTLTTHGGSDCGGYNVWIEIDVGHETCDTSIIDEYSAGDTLLWFGKYLGSCRSFHFETGLNMINFRVKTKSTNDFCPLYFYAFMENEQGITFKSEYMDAWHEVSKTNDKNHTARRTHGDFTLPIAGLKTPASNSQEEIFNKKEQKFEKLVLEYKSTRKVDVFLQGIVNVTHSSAFRKEDFTKKSCEQFELLLEDWHKNDMKVLTEHSKIRPNNSTMSFIEFIDFTWKLKRLINVKTAEYQDWTTTVRATAYGTATGVSVGMIIADIFGCLGICSATVTTSTWAATLATVESTIAAAEDELSGLETIANDLTAKVMEAHCHHS